MFSTSQLTTLMSRSHYQSLQMSSIIDHRVLNKYIENHGLLNLHLVIKWSMQRYSVKKGVLESFANFTGKYLCWGLFNTCNFNTKRPKHRCFPVKFEKILTIPILKKICERLLLSLTDFN